MESSPRLMPGYFGDDTNRTVSTEQVGWLRAQGDEDTVRYINLNFVPELVFKKIYKMQPDDKGELVVQKDADGNRIFLETQVAVRGQTAPDQVLQRIPSGSHHDAQLERLLLKIQDVLGNNIVDISRIS